MYKLHRTSNIVFGIEGHSKVSAWNFSTLGDGNRITSFKTGLKTLLANLPLLFAREVGGQAFSWFKWESADKKYCGLSIISWNYFLNKFLRKAAYFSKKSHVFHVFAVRGTFSWISYMYFLNITNIFSICFLRDHIAPIVAWCVAWCEIWSSRPCVSKKISKASNMEEEVAVADKQNSHQKKFKLVIFGATGRTGKEVVKQALERGHHVTAVVRTPEKLTIK